MKTILSFSMLFCAIAIPVFAELTPQDIDKISSIVKDSETQMKEHMNIKIESVEKQITLLTNFVYGLIALIVAAIAIPQILMAWRSGKDRSLERQVEVLTREIETLKRQRIANP